MFALKPRIEVAFRIVLTAVILVNALIPHSTVVHAEKETVVVENPVTQAPNQEDDPFPIFERPQARIKSSVNNNVFNFRSLLSSDNGSDDNTGSASNKLEDISPYDPQAFIQAKELEIKAKVNDAKQRIKPFTPPPNPVRKITPGSAADVRSKDIFSLGANSAERVFTVTTLEDHDDGICDSDCSLREAIYASNKRSGPDRIVFSVDGKFLMDGMLPYITDPAGLVIDDSGHNIQIGGGGSTSIQDRNSYNSKSISTKGHSQIRTNLDETSAPLTDLQFSLDRSAVLDEDPEGCFFNTEGSLSLSGSYSDCIVEVGGALTITNASFTSSYIHSDGMLTINNNSTFTGGTINNPYGTAATNIADSHFTGTQILLNDGNVVITDDSTFTNGILYAFAYGDEMTIENSAFSNFSVVGYSSFYVTDSTFSAGGEIYSNSTMSVTNGIFTSFYVGSAGTADLMGGSFSDNSSFVAQGEETIANSTFSQCNVYGNPLTITNTTFSDCFNVYGEMLVIIDSIFVRTAVYSNSTTTISSHAALTIANSTLIGNDSAATLLYINYTDLVFAFGDVPAYGDVGSFTSSAFIGSSLYSIDDLTVSGIGDLTSTNSTFLSTSIDSASNLDLYNTILANKSSCGRTVSHGSHNLVESNSTTGCGITAGVNGNIVTSHPNFATLAGLPSFVVLNAGSPAIDAGDNSICSDLPISSTSQNGFTRPQGTNCDIGSYEQPPLPYISENETVSTGNGEACMATQADANGWTTMPINTRTGDYEYMVEDLSVPTSAGPLTFTREYASLSIDNPTLLSPGWTHNHDTHLIMPDDPGGEEGMILFKVHTANQYAFTILENDTYSSSPGLCASLIHQLTPTSQFVVTDGSQNKYIFDGGGVLQSYEDAQGHAWTYIYDNGRLDSIEADGGSEYLDLEYQNGKLHSVSDQSGRSVIYDYDSSAGNLDTVTDVLEQTWTYNYDGDLDHFLTRVAAPGDVTVERTEYDPEGRAVRQYDGEGNLLVGLTYNTDGTTTIKDRVNDTHPETHSYDERGTLASITDATEGETGKAYDGNFRPSAIHDPNGNITDLVWDGSGHNLVMIRDAKASDTFISYGQLNNPVSIVDPLKYETRYSYEETNFPTLPTRIEYPLSFDGGITYIGTDYEYYDSGAAAGKVDLMTDALGKQTHYTYNSSGQVETVTTAYGTADALTTIYGYDDLGRLEDVTDEQGVVTHNEYDAAGHLTQVIRNVHPTNNTQNYQDKYNITTEYRYDVRGNQIAVIDTYGTTTRTYYDLNNRPITVVQNLTGQTIEETDLPAGGIGITDENIRTDTEYDDAGNVINTTDPAGIVTHMEYDEANRPLLMIQNYAGTGAYNPAYPDENIHTEYTYDVNGNVIAVTDTLGVITRTYYDALNRPVTTVQNLVGHDVSYNFPSVRSGGLANLRTDMVYDANGNMIATVDPRNITTRTYYDALNRPVTVVQNLAGQDIADSDPPDAGTGATDVNIRSDTYYDEAGNVIATVDPRGMVTRTYYDSANRPIATVNNFVEGDIYSMTIPERESGDPDENVRTDIAYDESGRRDTTTDPLGRVIKYEYDESGQLSKVTANYVNGGDPQNDDYQRNIVTTYTYDALGRQATTTDTFDRVTVNSYDDLGRLLIFTQNYLSGESQNYDDEGDKYNLVTTYAYDERGNQIAMTDTADVTTRTYYDSLGRPISVVRNLTGSIAGAVPERGDPIDPDENLRTDTVYLGNGNVDYIVDENGQTTDYSYDDIGRLITVFDPLSNAADFEYDANGNRTLMTDAEAVSTKYEYDALNRLSAVVENYRVGITPDQETNVRTEYTYDATGNRLSILDGNEHTTSFTYTLFGLLETETDALSHTSTYGYDAMGNRVSLLDANSKTTIYEYDELNRLELIDYPSPDADVSLGYDALGHRTSMTDGLGTTSWSYNNFDMPTYISDPFYKAVSYGYDELGNRTDLTYPDESVLHYEYNAVNRLEEVTSGQTPVASYEYDAVGRVKSVTRPNNVNTTYSYLDNGWLEDILHSSGTETVASYHYEYDHVGNRNKAVENVALPSVPPTETPTETVTPTETATATLTATETATSTSTDTPTSTVTDTATATATDTPTPTATQTYTATATDTSTSTPTATDTATPTVTPTFSETPTPSHTPTATNTPSPTSTSSDLLFADGFESGDFSAWDWGYIDPDVNPIVTESAAAVGDLGMQVFVDDESNNAVLFHAPSTAQSHYSARFYLDPNSVSIPDETGFVIFAGTDGGYVFLLYLVRLEDDYALVLVTKDDYGANHYGQIVYIADDWQAVEIEFQAASAEYAEDGYVKMWLDDTLVDEIEDLDSDTMAIGEIELGSILGIPSGVDGSIYFDAFEAHAGSHIGLDPNGPGSQQMLFSNRNSSPNQSTTDRMDTLLSKNIALSIAEAVTGADTYYRAQFYFDPKTTDAGNNGVFTIFEGLDDSSTVLLRVEVSKAKNGYFIRLRIRRDDLSWLDTSYVRLNDTFQPIALEWKAANSRNAKNGAMRLWLDGKPVASLANIDNDTYHISKIKLGAVLGIDTEKLSPASFDPVPAGGNVFVFYPLPAPAFDLLQQGEETDTPTPTLTPTPTATETATPTLTVSPTPTATDTPASQTPVTIDYVYDPLYRLTEANYSNDDYYHYTYDAVGNRLTEDDLIGSVPSETTYTYTDNNFVDTVDAIHYSYDNNGNLTYDGAYSYSYDAANRLTTRVKLGGPSVVTFYRYNGMGDRLQEEVYSGSTTTFTMDYNMGLTQALSDGTNTYLYGLDRIAQVNSATEYFLPDALGSVRQLTNETGAVTYARAYDPFGVVTATGGSSQTSYAFTGEYSGDYNELLYLRARHYSPDTGRFITKDPSRLEANFYTYSKANPINRVDPKGLFSKELIEKNISMNEFWFYDSWTEHSHWGFYALLRDAQNLDMVKTGYVPISLGMNYNLTLWSNPERIYVINCEKIMIGSQFLDQYYMNVVKKNNEPLLHWRDTTSISYELNSGVQHISYLDGFDNNKNTYPTFLGPSFGLWYGEVGVLVDMDGNKYLAISGGAGNIAGIGYMEGYLCDWRPGPSCGGQPSSAEIEQAIAGICLGGELVLLTGINVGLFCHGPELSKPLDWSSSISTFYVGLEAGLGAGVTITVPLSAFGVPPQPDRGWRWLIEKRMNGITYDKIK